MKASEIRKRVIEECRAALKGASCDFKGKEYDQTYGWVDSEGLTLEQIDTILNELVETPIDRAMNPYDLHAEPKK